MTWRSVTETLAEGVIHVQLVDDVKSLSFGEVSRLLQENREFQLWLTEKLKRVPMPAYYWETPPVTKTTLSIPFEYVVIDAPMLARQQPDRDSFSVRFREATEQVTRFYNLGRDATLVAPVPLRHDDHYTHLGSFLRSAPAGQICAIWRTLFKTLTEILSDSPIWMSTSGLGVAWLHFRLDSVPKYYNHMPYRNRA